MSNDYLKEVDFHNKFDSIIKEAEEKWRVLSKAVYDEIGDIGSCTIGDGIKAYMIPKGCRKPQTVMIISSNAVSFCQGSIHYERHARQIVDELKVKGVDCYYDYGRMG